MARLAYYAATLTLAIGAGLWIGHCFSTLLNGMPA